jgi:hypothetical protein
VAIGRCQWCALAAETFWTLQGAPGDTPTGAETPAVVLESGAKP